MIIIDRRLRRQLVGNKAKGRISKLVLQENKARQIFKKNEHFLPPDTHNILVSRVHEFWIVKYWKHVA